MRKFLKVSELDGFIEKYGAESGTPIEQSQLAIVIDIYSYADARGWEVLQIIPFTLNGRCDIIIVYYDQMG